MTTRTEIPVDWVAFELNQVPRAVLAWADRLGLEHRRDDSGRQWIAEPDARRVIDEVRRVGRENAELHQAYDDYLIDWQRRQREAGEEVFRAILAGEHQRQASAGLPTGYAFVGGADLLQPGPRAHEHANTQAAEARAEWARNNPKQTFEQFEKRWRKARRT